MSVPGLLPGLQQLSEAVETPSETIQELQAGREWRFEVAFGSTIEIKVTRGTAEIFGTELPVGNKFSFTGIKSAIYTWTGCTLEITGTPSVEYTSEETPMNMYANAHFALEKLRGKAAESPTAQGPRAMIIGPHDAGKTSLLKILTGYAVRQGRRPVVVNLDPREGMLSLPGTLTAVSFSTIMDVEEGFGTSPTSGPSPVPAKLPLVYYYGVENPEGNEKLYKSLVSRLALAVSSKLSEDDYSRTSGCIIDTSGFIAQSSGYDMIQHIVAEFSVDTLLVLGSERLYSDMCRRFEDRPQNPVTVVKLQKSGGCVDREESFMKQSRETAIREYFFGEPKRTLSPYTMSVVFDDLKVWRVGQASNVGSELLPAGEELKQPLYITTEPSVLLQHSIMAVVNANLDDSEEALAESTVMGFVYVASVDDQKRYMKILAPVSGRLPPKPLIVSSYPEPTFSLVG
ncbi:Pre-mRNA cleavage complex II protein Clp1-domain-containing protein [Sphaerosporella brunnea]|uniref:Polynucleotide 5'-hydroxyl-kinase GRC3 n=1 Tax=Sphaerosporella brunnea TaxID=1250544 RepID=A0A5J5EJ76_9PEZI|nr:Pre-mRNA cleavage complex II protein Clp1-domain-containing protein [Sphaerosporella brunnea]